MQPVELFDAIRPGWPSATGSGPSVSLLVSRVSFPSAPTLTANRSSERGAGPSSFPEEFPEIETESQESEDISFSDIRGDMDAPLPADRPAARNQAPEREEVLPSEEITQGTQSPKDNLLPQETEEAIRNPFDEEPAFEEINMSAPTSASPLLPEFDTKSDLKVPRSDNGPKDVSDEFHERFLEIANEDTSEDLLKSSLE